MILQMSIKRLDINTSKFVSIRYYEMAHDSIVDRVSLESYRTNTTNLPSFAWEKAFWKLRTT